MLSNKGLTPARSRVQSPNSRIQASQGLRCSQQVAASDRPFRVGILKPPIPGRAKRSSLRQLAVSRILAQSPFFLGSNQGKPRFKSSCVIAPPLISIVSSEFDFERLRQALQYKPTAEPWLKHSLSRNIKFTFLDCAIMSHCLCISRASRQRSYRDREGSASF
jgi:hypothetical protein